MLLASFGFILLLHLSSASSKTRHRLSAGGTELKFHKRACGVTAWREGEDGVASKSAYLGLWSMHKLKEDAVSEATEMRANLSGISFDFGGVKNGSLLFGDNVNATMVPFRTELHFATVRGMIAVAKDSGVIRMGSHPNHQEIHVRPGHVQILVKVCHLTWHHLHKRLGDYVDIKFKVKDRSLHQVVYSGEKGPRTARYQMGWTTASGHVDVPSMVYRDSEWVPMLSGYPRPERGPEGEHLLAIRAYLRTDCLAVVMVMEPGDLNPEAEAANVVYEDVTWEDGSSAQSASSSSLLQIFTVILFYWVNYRGL